MRARLIRYGACAALALAFLCGPTLAHAQQTATTASQAGAEAIAIAPGASGDPAADSTQTIRNVPDIGIASYAGGTNPCGIGGSLGVAVAGVGVGGSVATTSKECSKRAWFLLMAAAAEHTHNPAYMQWAVGIACSQGYIRAVAPAGLCQPAEGRAMARAAPAPSAAPAMARIDRTQGSYQTAAVKPRPVPGLCAWLGPDRRMQQGPCTDTKHIYVAAR